MNQVRNSQDREDGYQNTGRGARGFQNRPGPGVGQVHPNLNPNYQNPVDIVRNYNRARQHQDPEENIYERLDNDDEENNRVAARNEPSGQNNPNHGDDHTYERIDDRHTCRVHCSYRYHILKPEPSFLGEMEARNLGQYDQPRHLYLDPSRLANQFCQNRLGRLGRNCFSTENIAYASARRPVHPFGYGCVCPFCRHLDARYFCHQCHNLHTRLRYPESLGTGPRHYIYQLPRNCRCPFCRGEYSYVKLPVGSCRPSEYQCSCRARILSSSSSAVQIGRYLDWINRGGPVVNNPLYATIHVGRIERACVSALGGSGGVEAGPSNPGPSSSGTLNEPSAATSGTSRSNPSGSAVCSMTRSERQHTCDDSCIRNHAGNVAGVCQFLGRCERAECNHGRMSTIHWWLVNKWLPLWNPHNERHVDSVPTMEEEQREQPDSDSDEP